MELTTQNFVSSGLRSQRSHIVEKFCVLTTDFSFTVYVPPAAGVLDDLLFQMEGFLKNPTAGIPVSDTVCPDSLSV